MFNYENYFDEALNTLKREHRYRYFREISRVSGSFPEAVIHNFGPERAITVWCSNDYLGMGQNPVVVEAMKKALDEYGAGAGGTRNISGNHHVIVELERELAEVHEKEAGLVFTSGYVANETALATLGTVLPNCLILSDSHNHASMIEGMRHSKAERKVFRHNDVAHLEQLLSEIPRERAKIVAFESLYSMDGDFAPAKELIEVAKRYGALVYVDETHAVGLYGNRGGGVMERDKLLAQVDILQGGLGKGYGVVGGFITGSKMLVDVVRSYGSGFIFTTTLPPVVAAGALASVRHLKFSQTERRRLFEVVAMTRKALEEADLPVKQTQSQILPLMVCDAAKCLQLSERLLEDYSVYAQPINYPTVPKGTERLRITPSAAVNADQIEHFTASIGALWHRLKLRQAA